MYGNLAHNTYVQNNMEIESPSKLIEMLYEGVLRFNAQARKSMKDGDVEKRVYWVNRSIAIVTELSAILDMTQGQVSEYLEGLYNYEIQLLSFASLENDMDKLDEVSNVFRGLIDAWRDTVNVVD